MDGYKLKVKRIEKGISLSKLSELTGISKSYLSLIERNIQNNPSIDILDKLAKTLEVEVKDLVRGEQEDKDLFCKRISNVKSNFKLEIEIPGEQLTPKKLKQIKQLIEVLNTE
jgi:transcriptional regulator with XRE-family HTH domain